MAGRREALKRRKDYNREWVSAKRSLAALNNSNTVAFDETDKYLSDSEHAVRFIPETGIVIGETCNNNETVIVVQDASAYNGDSAAHEAIEENVTVDNDHDVPRPGAELYLSVSSDLHEDEVSLRDDLSAWVNENQVKHCAVDSLLKLMKNHGHNDLPKTARTLLKTDRQLMIDQKSGMDYIYLDLKESLARHLQRYSAETLQKEASVSISLNVDGLPLFKSSRLCMWPILCAIQLDPVTVFPVAITCGQTKPQNLDFLADTIADLQHILQTGVEVQGNVVPVVLSCVVCDAPARAMVRAAKLFNGYYGCERCTQKGMWVGRVTYQQTVNLVLRTDHSFRNRTHAEHHQARDSPFTDLRGVDLVKIFPLDYMHQACLGVMKKLLLLWLRGPRENRLCSRQVKEISMRLTQQLRPCIPDCFARKPRGLQDIDRWKATELRQFMLYTGKVVLKDILREDLYQHFLALSVAMCLLVSPKLAEKHKEYAQGLLVFFVRRGRELYGQEFLVYNVHAMLHIAEDAKTFRGLDRCAAFPFENYLQKMKRMVRTGKSPLSQVVKRIHELDITNQLARVRQERGIQLRRPNNAFILEDGTCCEVVELTNETDEDGHKRAYCRVYARTESVFINPCDSKLIGAYRVDTNNSRMRLLRQTSLTKRAILVERGAGRHALFLSVLHRI